MIKVKTTSPEDTIAFAEKIGKLLHGGDVIAYKGGLGAGKTTFTRGLAVGLGLPDEVFSPTFALVNEYIGGRLSLYHFDMYRIESWEDLYSSGFFDYKEAGGVIAAEWSENIEGALDYDTIVISFERLSDNSRKITVFKGEDK